MGTLASPCPPTPHSKIPQLCWLILAAAMDTKIVDLTTSAPTAPIAKPSQFPALQEAAADWLDAITTSGASAATVELAHKCLDAIARLPADVDMDCFSRSVCLTTTICLEFLGSSWMRDEHINAGFNLVSQQLGLHARVSFLMCWHLDILHGFRYGNDGLSNPNRLYNPKMPRYGDRDVCLGLVDRVFIPVFVNGNHWTLIIVDLRAHTISFFDPMRRNALPPEDKLSDLRWWLHGLLPGHLWPVVPTPVVSQVQTDGSSCGIVILSAAASLLLGYPPWMQSAWREARMDWFLRLTEFWHADNLISIQDSAAENAPPSPPQYDTNELAASSLLPAADTATPCAPLPALDIFDANMDDLEAPEDSADPCAPWLLACRVDQPLPLADLTRQSLPAHGTAPSSALDVTMTEYFDAVSTIPHFLDEPDGTGNTPDRDATPPREKRRASDSGAPRPSKRARLSPSGSRARPKRRVQTPEQRLASFRDSIRRVDPDAKFHATIVCAVQCGQCGKLVRAHKVYETGRFKEHREGCKPKGTHILHAFRAIPAEKLLSVPTASTSRVPAPCPGLTTAVEPRIARYLKHTVVPGGGAPSRSKLASQMFGRPLIKLTDRQNRSLRARESHEYRWLNRHGLQAVFSAHCLHSVMAKDDAQPGPCESCVALLSIKEFKNALARPIPPDKNLKFVPEAYREHEIGHLYLRYHGLADLVDENITKPAQMLRDFAKGVLAGDYKEDGVFLGAVQAMVSKKSREVRGKGLQNFKYPEAFDNACFALRSISGRAYDMFRAIWGGRTPRSIRAVERKSPRFCPGLSKENVDSAATIIASYNYTGPVIVACDDTKLEPGLRACTRNLARNWLTYSQLRTWVLIIPVPRIPPIIIVSEARDSTDDAEALFKLHKQVWGMLRDAHIHPIAYAADGTETERKLQRLITQSATSTDRYDIPNPQNGCSLSIDVPVIDGHPVVMVQDSKHAMKTARNQLFTGARALVLGGGAMYYNLVRDIANHQDSPLFRRDVENVDKQDDHAGSRLFAVETLEHHHSRYPSRSSLGVYLYFMGSLFDAWQSRRMTHAQRILIALRCHFFLQTWRAHIVAHPDHHPSQNFISRESEDIFRTLCRSLIALILSYRKYYPDCPLLPWLHSTEPEEHVYGVSRMLKPDFTYADFLELVPKIGLYLMGQLATMGSRERASLTASGYWHTWTKSADIDLTAAVSWPSDDDIARLSVQALNDVRTILLAVGIHVNRVIHLPLQKKRAAKKAKAATTKGKKAQPVVAPTRVQPKRNVVSLAREPGLLYEWSNKKEPRSLSELRALRSSLESEESTVAKKLDVTAAALAAADLDESNAIIALPDMDDAAYTANSTAVRDFVQHATTAHAPSYPLPKPLFNQGQKFDFQVLIDDRRAHQNAFTSEAVRKGLQKKAVFPTQSASEETTVSLKERLAARFCDLVKSAGNRAGYSRLRRWGCDSATADKDKLAVARVEKAQKHNNARHASFRSLAHIHTRFTTANVNFLHPLDLSRPTYVLVFVPGTNARVALGEVVAMYTIVGGRHATVDRVDTPGLLSYLTVQIYTPAGGVSYTSSGTHLGTATFAHLRPTHLLFNFASFEISRQDLPDGSMTLLTPSTDVIDIVDGAANAQTAIERCVKAFKKALKAALPEDLDEGDSESEEEG
ncbi:hypothetical protein AURDEDRAFT_129656 [Auricularia subglabra TFB-10046 SS5]|nr:hypothetical protein AURDEDRAFT_129656 [Auricularia subglabra TFB-10046 SS5]